MAIPVDVPAGVVVQSFQPEVSQDGIEIVYNCFLDQSRHNVLYTLGSRLGGSKFIHTGMQQALTKSWSHIKDKFDRSSKGGGEVCDY